MKYSRATGRRKTSVAQVRLLPGKGNMSVNKKDLSAYFPVDSHQKAIFRPFDITKTEGKFDVFITVHGGGISGQCGAVQLGISRALVIFDEQLKESLREARLLTRDPRMVERKKYGRKKARKRFQFSKR